MSNQDQQPQDLADLPRDQWPPAIYGHCVDCLFYLGVQGMGGARGGLCREKSPTPMLVMVPVQQPGGKILQPQQQRPQMVPQLQGHYAPVPPWESCGRWQSAAGDAAGSGDDDEGEGVAGAPASPLPSMPAALAAGKAD